jgi:hypothetical protein
VTDPVKAIQTVRHRLARLAALQMLASAVPPLIVLAGAAFFLRALGEKSWERLGFAMASDTLRIVQIVLLCAAALGLVIAAIVGLFSFRRANDPIAAAELIDRKLGCHEEVLTLASFADTSGPARSVLFPVLWRRAAQHLNRLDPVRNFPFDLRQTLRQAAFLTVSTIGLLIAGISVLLAANKPPFGTEARQLRKIAREIASSSPSDRQTQELAAHLRAAADTLANPKVPPQTKLEQLASVEQELKTQQQRRQQQAQASTGESTGKANGKGNQGQGAGEAKEAAGQGKQGAGAGQGKGGAKGTGENTGKSGNGEVQLAQARKDISKVQARLEAEAKLKSGQQQKSGLKAREPHPGEQPDLAKFEGNGNLPNPNQPKPGQQQNQEQGNIQHEQPGQPRKDYGSSQGDTHLGQFPQPGNFERFYKAGEHGTPLDIKNARYVLFRIPPALISAGTGKSVIDKDRPSATVPYANLPLKEERIAAEPDERQLIPPRYRELLR